MHIDRLRIVNFRNLADIDLRLLPGTVIVGENRVGKSNLLHAIRLVLDPALANSDRRLRREDFWDGLSDGTDSWDPMVSRESIEIIVEISGFEHEPAVVTALSDALTAGDPMRAKLTYRWEPKDGEESGVAYRWIIFGGDDEASRVSDDLRQYILVSFLHALRDVEQDIRSWRRSPLRILLEAAAEAAATEDLNDIRAAMDEANVKLNELDSISKLGADISDRTAEMVGENQALDARLGVAPSDPLRLIRSMQVLVDGNASRQLHTASLGTLNVLYLTLLELGLEQRLSENDVAHVLLAVEEPEAHLHPHLQRLIFRRLLTEENRARTVLVTTQSPYIASVAPPRSLVVLRREADQTLASSAAEANLSEGEWADIERYLDATRAEIVFSQRVLLVEGYAEQVLVPALAQSAGYDLNKLGITICAIHGTHFFAYRRFCDALDIRAAVLTDGDPALPNRSGARRAEQLIKRLGLAGSAPENGIFIGGETFEYDVLRASDANRTKCYDMLLQLTPNSQRSIIEGWGDSLPTRDDYMKAIERVGGKGRFAQRLSTQLLDVPRYLSDCLDYLAPPS